MGPWTRAAFSCMPSRRRTTAREANDRLNEYIADRTRGLAVWHDHFIGTHGGAVVLDIGSAEERVRLEESGPLASWQIAVHPLTFSLSAVGFSMQTSFTRWRAIEASPSTSLPLPSPTTPASGGSGGAHDRRAGHSRTSNPVWSSKPAEGRVNPRRAAIAEMVDWTPPRADQVVHDEAAAKRRCRELRRCSSGRSRRPGRGVDSRRGGAHRTEARPRGPGVGQAAEVWLGVRPRIRRACGSR